MKYAEGEAGRPRGNPDPATSGDHALREIERQRSTVDQMATSHSMLRGQYRRRAVASTCVLLAASVVATAFAFASGDAKISLLVITIERSTLLGWFAMFTFTLTLIDLVLDWRGRARGHEDAVRQLAVLKAEYRALPAAGDEAAARERVSQRYQAVMDALPPVPEAKFLRLKARHLRKVEMSRILSDNPGITVRQARKVLRRRSREKS
ncbi:hypothetical protein [Streptosporangium sp. LJ11]|uniref:hypothetical protein n=1 Tax=Streptosporangium sp. LJ11 TaxID=3436927 RepID=UPI003F7972F8